MGEDTIRITKELIFETICLMFGIIWYALVDYILKDAKTAFCTALRYIWRCIAHASLSQRRKERKPRHIHHAFIMAAVLIPSVHTTTVAFSSLAIVIRKVYLQRTQDKGPDDSSSIGYFNYIALPTS